VNTTAEVVAFLRDRAWPDDPPALVETHLSWVFLTGERAYKLKKPIRLDFVDARSVEARRRDCRAEVTLNGRLAPGVYLGTRAVRRRVDGGLELAPPQHHEPDEPSDDGGVVDWLVEMRRLPDDGMLDRRLAHGLPSAVELDGLADHLATFYLGAARHPRTPAAHRAVLTGGLTRDLAVLRRHAADLDDHPGGTDGTDRAGRPGRTDRTDRTDRTGREVPAWLDRLDHLEGDLLGLLAGDDIGARGVAVVDGHGDLRPEHVLLGPPPLVIDCITYDPALRRLDPYHDLALLVVEADLLGVPAFGPALLRRFADRTHDEPTGPVLATACALRAVTRARLSVAHLDDRPDGRRDRPGHWAGRARRYLALARRQLRRADWPGTTGPATQDSAR
jgi:aminoglycoside phosphotransferase family enzyme